VLHPQATMRRFGLRCKRELLLRPYAKIVLALGGDLPVATRAWWYFRRTVKLRVIQYEFETYVGRTLLIGRERWLAKYSDGWSEVLVGPTSTFPVTDENTHRSLEKEGMKHWGGVMQQLVQEADAAANDPDPKFLETSRSETQPSSRAA